MSALSMLPASTDFGWSEAQLGARAFSPRSSPMRMMSGGLLAADVLLVLIMACAAHLLRYGGMALSLEIAVTSVLAAVLLANVLTLTGCYGRLLNTGTISQITRALQGWCLVFTAMLIFAYLTKTSEQFSRVWVLTWFVLTMGGLVSARIWAATWLRHWRRMGKLARTVAVVDLDGRGVALAGRLMNGSAGEMQLLGVFVPVPDGLRRNGIENLLGLARLFRVDEVIIAAGDGVAREVDALTLRLGAIPTNVRLSPPTPAITVSPRDASLLYGQPMLTLSSRPLGDWSRVAKRIEDLLISIAAIVFVAPLLAVAALAVKLDSAGPILFRQKRLGFNNNVITVYKFRTMTHRGKEDDDVPQAKRIDPRVTRVGRVLRRTSVDELPQLINVFRGEMSLVGPRPHALAHNDQYSALIDGYLGRHRVQPGITGLAQVNGCRGETDTLEKMQRRVDYDLAYIDAWCLPLDFKILFLTIFTTLFDRNAY